ncbi:hypothetical protein FGIG_01901 [Fasciola gigantica]|uniref:Peptidase A2 domain-containing protein n=1 Tax=Fasciola gigantica TaxID=46835 RepID=A0A504YDA9_FASGI|nr:hypothetical protein FGIG_01901 [Fasciola gigantica]
MGISGPKTKENFLLNVPTSLQAALLRARKLEACREALRQLPNKKIAVIQPAVFKPQPSRTPLVSYPGPQPYCRYRRKFGPRAQHFGHNPAMQYTGESQYRVMSLPFVSLNNNDWQSPLVVEGLLNGKGAKLLIDPGASCSVINSSLAKISRSVPLNGGGQREYRAMYCPTLIPLCRRSLGRNSRDQLSTGPPNSHRFRQATVSG